MVQVNLRGWDTHQNAFRDLKGQLLPSIDHCLSGFLDDLAARGLLDETLIVMCGEMGRTPRISPISAGRQERLGRAIHAGPAPLGRRLPLLLRRRRRAGRAHDRPDRPPGGPASQRSLLASDLAATIFRCLGIQRDRVFHDLEQRPHQLYQGRAIEALFLGIIGRAAAKRHPWQTARTNRVRATVFSVRECRRTEVE